MAAFLALGETLSCGIPSRPLVLPAKGVLCRRPQRDDDPGAEDGGGGRGTSGVTPSCPTYLAGPGEERPRVCLSWPLLRYLGVFHACMQA